VDTLSRKI